MHPTLRRLACASSCGAFLAAAALVARAGFTNPFVPDFRGAPLTEYGSWESFTYAHTFSNAPDDPTSTSIDAGLVQLDTTAFLTTGNIYSFSAPLRCVLSDSVPADLQELALQVSTKGSELDYANVRLEYLDAGGGLQAVPWTSTKELARSVSVGVDVETLFEWDLTAIPDEIVSYQILLEARGPHMSLDALVLDTRHADPSVTVYCTAKLTSSGCTPSIGWSGTPSASGAFAVLASQVEPTQLGVLFYALNGPAALPFQGGFLCVQPPVKRLGLQGSGGSAACSGAFAVDFSAHVAAGADPALVPGAQVWSQFWFRDAGAASGTGLTNALQFTLH